MYDRETGKPKGYGFCEYQDQETALSAMRNLNGREFSGRALRVDNAASEKNKEELKSESDRMLGAPSRWALPDLRGVVSSAPEGHMSSALGFHSQVIAESQNYLGCKRFVKIMVQPLTKHTASNCIAPIDWGSKCHFQSLLKCFQEQ